MTDSAASLIAIAKGMFTKPMDTIAGLKPMALKDAIVKVYLPFFIISLIASSLSVFITGMMTLGMEFAIGMVIPVVITSIVGAAVGLPLMGVVFAVAAKLFGGKSDIQAAICMLVFASVPALLGTVFTIIPLLGSLIALGFSIYTLVLIYKSVPMFLAVPNENMMRPLHFIVSLVGAAILYFVLTSVITMLTVGAAMTASMATMGGGY